MYDMYVFGGLTSSNLIITFLKLEVQSLTKRQIPSQKCYTLIVCPLLNFLSKLMKHCFLRV